VFILKPSRQEVFVSTENASDMHKLALNCLQAFHEGLERNRNIVFHLNF